jgi:hypothetical protein
MIDEIWEDEDNKDERKKKNLSKRKNAQAIEEYTDQNWKAS